MTTVENPYEKVRGKMVTARIEFMAQLARFSADELNKVPAEGEWSPLTLAYDLYIADGLALQQMQLVQNEENPLIVDVEEEAPRLTRSSEPPTSLESVLAGMAARREEIFEYLAGLPPEAWNVRSATPSGASASSTNSWTCCPYTIRCMPSNWQR
jgi:hypothetical protein